VIVTCSWVLEASSTSSLSLSLTLEIGSVFIRSFKGLNLSLREAKINADDCSMSPCRPRFSSIAPSVPAAPSSSAMTAEPTQEHAATQHDQGAAPHHRCRPVCPLRPCRRQGPLGCGVDCHRHSPYSSAQERDSGGLETHLPGSGASRGPWSWMRVVAWFAYQGATAPKSRSWNGASATGAERGQGRTTRGTGRPSWCLGRLDGPGRSCSVSCSCCGEPS